jgi:hypothetical protein
MVLARQNLFPNLRFREKIFCFGSPETIPETKGFRSRFGEGDTVPETEGSQYVMVSRATSLEGLVILSPFPKDKICCR